MKIYVCCLLSSLFAFFTLSSCEEEALHGSKGGFTVSLVDDLTGMVVTKSTPAELGTPLTSQFTLRIKNTETGVYAYDGLCGHTYYEVPAATYDLVASYGENPDLAFDSPYYRGELTNQVVESSGKNVSIPCSVANALVSVRYINPSIFDLAFTSYGIVAKAGASSLGWTSSNSEKSVYLKAGSTASFVFKGILRGSNQEVEFPLQQGLPETYEAKDHYILYLNYQAGESKLNITTERKEATINETVPQSWLPKPSAESVDFVNKVLVMKETMSPNAVIHLKVARPLQDLMFKLELEDPNFQDLNKEYVLSTLSNDDREALEKAGLLLPDIGSSEPSINISELAGKLQTINGGQTISNYILINPKANDRWNAAEGEYGERYMIRVEKPEFKVSVSEGNIWTKEFTIDEVSVMAGNLDILKKQIKYQYSNDGGTTWIDCNKDRQQQFNDHPQNKSFQVRALYRNEIVSELEHLTLENPEQLPNSGMENWHTGKANAGSILYYYPWDSGAGSFWDTNNEFTMRYSVTWFPSSYNRFPAVSFTRSGRNGSLAAELRNTAAGPVGTNNIVYDGNKTSGMLFIGDYTGTTSTALADGAVSINKGREFRSRPTKLCFYYLYSPYDGDEKDTFDAQIQVLDSDNNVVGEGYFSSNKRVDSYTLASLNIDYDKYITKAGSVNKAVKIYVFFQSSTAGNNIPFGKKRDLSLGDEGNKTTHYGSVLRIDDIELIYDK